MAPSAVAAVAPTLTGTTTITPSPSPLPHLDAANAYINLRRRQCEVDTRKVLDILLNPTCWDPMLMSDAGTTNAAGGQEDRNGRVPALTRAKVLSLEVDLTNHVGDKAAMARRIRDLATVVKRILADDGAGSWRPQVAGRRPGSCSVRRGQGGDVRDVVVDEG
ncbi:hypothetical protein PVAP13_1KG036900 [Panicum virgatum]|uniref:Uncharacterized protein n=1 Tax=Panicum virgatum TaxID=38727 RepID=A0A8T0X2J4_PANVG|nr:hypothetical protein PVAP13_1KG036900 [Panicum virgatum]